MVYDVIVSGAGPVGLFLACELGMSGISVLVLEALAEPGSVLKRVPFGLRGLWGPSLEALYRRGLLGELTPQSRSGPASTTSPRRGSAGHFAGLPLDHANIDPSRWRYRLPGPVDAQMGVELEQLERVLGRRATGLGVEIRRGCAVEQLESVEDGVAVRCGNERFQARWLVGCDGGRSTVRKQAGIDFVGTDPELTGYTLGFELADPASLPLGRHRTHHGMYTQWQEGVVALIDFDGGAFHRKEVTPAHAEALLRRVSGRDVTITAMSVATTWTDRAMQAGTYRRGRVLLAGDAAHVHSPLGGQGLNLGFGDAMNLGWKLAATVRGRASESLLDTYTAERHPVGARILEWTRAQVALLRPSSCALEAVVRDLMDTRDGATYFAERLWGVGLRYDLGEPHPLVGRSCPDFELADGTRLGELLRHGEGLLLDFDQTSTAELPGVRHVRASAKERLGLHAVLVRPDGIVAYATDERQRTEDVVRAAARWFS